MSVAIGDGGADRDARSRISDPKRLLLRAGLALTLASLLVVVVKMALAAWVALKYPYDLDYGEGIVWQQMRNILAGEGYAPLGIYPAIVYHYPPVYHLVTGALAWATGIDELFAGRLVSLLSTIASMALVGRLTWSAIPSEEDTVVRWLAAAIAATCLATIPTIVDWATLMRVDMLGCAWTMAGLVFAHRAVTRPKIVPLSALAFVLAVYTKQTNIAGPIASFVLLWCVRPRSALALLGWCLGLGLAALAVLTVESDGGFLRHVLSYNVNRIDWGRWRLLRQALLFHAVLIGLAGFAIAQAWRRLTQASHAGPWRSGLRDESRAALVLALAFLAVKTAMIPTILKSGSSANYLIEWSCGIVVFAGLAAVPVLRVARGGEAWPSPILIALLTIMLPIATWQVPMPEIDPSVLRTYDAQKAAMVDRIRAAEKPVVADDMVLLIRAGRPVEYEPAIAAELGHSGVYDEAGFIAKVRRGDFAFFLTRGNRSDPLFDERYNPRVADAIDAAYPRKERDGNLTFHLPAR
ncbi:hypothetical protein [uncultured Sphingomonas sp.]|uniref:hypothetical protein n=1 Tax=uncultured Sphingomonas sp. TaxID=158754 RepID=UPI0025E454F7|nr:hypothetical protein [uncultured Sphingomonas sp.]